MNYKGDIKGFPVEVVNWMLDQQEAQGNKRDVSVFEKDKVADKSSGGFDWSSEGFDWGHGFFCDKVIGGRNFNLFFKEYPKQDIPSLDQELNSFGNWLLMNIATGEYQRSSNGIAKAVKDYLKTNTMKDLTKILKTGDEVYCVLTGEYHTITVDDDYHYPICIGNDTYLSKYGQNYINKPNAECLIWPSKEERSWDNYPKFKRGDLVLMWDEGSRGKLPTIFHSQESGRFYGGVLEDGELIRNCCRDHCEHLTPEMIEEFLKQVDQ